MYLASRLYFNMSIGTGTVVSGIAHPTEDVDEDSDRSDNEAPRFLEASAE